MENEIKVKSLYKALEILNCFVGKDSLGVTEIRERFGLCKSNVHNILSTFRQMGYLEQNEATGKYRLGMQIFVLCKGLSDSFPKMCIRDRSRIFVTMDSSNIFSTRTFKSPEVLTQPEMTSLPGPTLTGTGSPVTGEAVSYTHLLNVKRLMRQRSLRAVQEIPVRILKSRIYSPAGGFW